MQREVTRIEIITLNCSPQTFNTISILLTFWKCPLNANILTFILYQRICDEVIGQR